MRILAFTIGQHFLGLPADQISSVGKRSPDKKAKKKAGGEREYDLAEVMKVSANSADRAIVCNYKGGSISLFVEKIIGLVDLDESALNGWPVILNGIPVFYGIGLTDTTMYLLVDLAKINNLKAGQ